MNHDNEDWNLISFMFGVGIGNLVNSILFDVSAFHYAITGYVWLVLALGGMAYLKLRDEKDG